MKRNATSPVCYKILSSFCTLVFVGFFVLPPGVMQAEEELWKNCSTPRTQYVLQVPGSLVPSASAPAAGCSYQTPDGEFTVEAMEQTEATGPAQDIEARMQKEISVMAGTVNHQEKGDNWFLLSGVTSDGTQYFRKHFTNGTQSVTLRITYPHDKHKKYKKWVKRIEKKFVPFSKQEPTEKTEKQ